MNFRDSLAKLQAHSFYAVNNNQTVLLWSIMKTKGGTALSPPPLFFFLAWRFMNILTVFTQKFPSVAGSWLPTLVVIALAKLCCCYTEHHLDFSELKGRQMWGNLDMEFFELLSRVKLQWLDQLQTNCWWNLWIKKSTKLDENSKLMLLKDCVKIIFDPKILWDGTEIDQP